MLRILRTFGLPALIGLAVSSACSDNPPTGSNDGGAGEGGSPSAQGGKSGSAGSAGKNGNGGKSGGGGSAGSTVTIGGAGQGGEGGAPECPGCDSGFCLDDGTCVECSPSNDQCSDGQYCSDANECVPGCKASGAGCASGACDEDHNCTSCISDDECLAPLLCSNGTCSAACTAAAQDTNTGCSDGLTCCSLRCAELATDNKNCGSCGHACSANQFCGVTDCGAGGAGGAGGMGGMGSGECSACHDTTFANICAVSKIIVILDSTLNDTDGNRTPGRKVGAALHAQCSPAPALTEAEQDSVDALNFTTGRPVAGGGELLVVAGGPFYQRLEGYLEEQKIAPLYVSFANGVAEFRKTADDSLVVSRDAEDPDNHETEDDFIIQFSRDPLSGSLVLNVQGFWLSGTVAAAYQVTSGLLPELETRDRGWYAYTWTDADGDKAPDADEIELIDSGN